MDRDEILRTCYCKRGSPDYSIDGMVQEVQKDVDLVKSGNHPHIGYVDRSKPGWKITDAWWM